MEISIVNLIVGWQLLACSIFNGRVNSRAGGTPCNGLYGEAPPERGTLFRLEVYKRVGISRVEVHKRVGKTDI